MQNEEKNIAVNRKARHDYHIIQSFEAGISLLGTEVKALRQNKVNLKEGYGLIKGNEAFLIGVHIGIYDFGNIHNHEPLRERKLLLNRREIKKIKSLIDEKGNSFIPLRFYFLRGKVKVEMGIGKGKKLYDKRQDIKQRDIQRDIDKNLKY